MSPAVRHGFALAEYYLRLSRIDIIKLPLDSCSHHLPGDAETMPNNSLLVATENEKSVRGLESPDVQKHLNESLPQAPMGSIAGASNEATVKKSEPAKNEERHFLTGIKLVILISAVTLVNFLILLDMTIIATVCFPFLV